MKIHSIILNNIKSHKSTEINFNDGINIIYGHNGSGKSTIIEAIEISLFNTDTASKKFKNDLKSYIRKGADIGRIEIKIENNGKLYYIKSVIDYRSKSNKKFYSQITDDNNIPIEIENQGKFVREHILSISEKEDPKSIFESIIIAKQGELHLPFILSYQKRKDYFEKILKVFVFRELQKEVISINNSVTKRYISQREDNLKLLKENLSAFPDDLEDNIKYLQQKNLTNTAELSDINTKIINLKEVIKKYKDKQEYKMILNERVKGLDNNLANLNNQKNKIEDDIIEADKSKEYVEKYKNDYDEYLIIINSIDGLLERKDFLTIQNNKINNLRSVIDGLNKEQEYIIRQKEQIKTDISNISSEKENKWKLINENEKKIKNIKNKINFEKQKINKINNINNLFSNLLYEKENLISNLKKKNDIINSENIKYSDLTNEISRDEIEFTDINSDDLSDDLERLYGEKTEIEKKTIELDKINTEIQYLEKGLNNTKSQHNNIIKDLDKRGEENIELNKLIDNDKQNLINLSVKIENYQRSIDFIEQLIEDINNIKNNKYILLNNIKEKYSVIDELETKLNKYNDINEEIINNYEKKLGVKERLNNQLLNLKYKFNNIEENISIKNDMINKMTNNICPIYDENCPLSDKYKNSDILIVKIEELKKEKVNLIKLIDEITEKLKSIEKLESEYRDIIYKNSEKQKLLNDININKTQLNDNIQKFLKIEVIKNDDLIKLNNYYVENIYELSENVEKIAQFNNKYKDKIDIDNTVELNQYISTVETIYNILTNYLLDINEKYDNFNIDKNKTEIYIQNKTEKINNNLIKIDECKSTLNQLDKEIIDIQSQINSYKNTIKEMSINNIENDLENKIYEIENKKTLINRYKKYIEKKNNTNIIQDKIQQHLIECYEIVEAKYSDISKVEDIANPNDFDNFEEVINNRDFFNKIKQNYNIINECINKKTNIDVIIQKINQDYDLTNQISSIFDNAYKKLDENIKNISETLTKLKNDNDNYRKRIKEYEIDYNIKIEKIYSIEKEIEEIKNTINIKQIELTDLIKNRYEEEYENIIKIINDKNTRKNELKSIYEEFLIHNIKINNIPEKQKEIMDIKEKISAILTKTNETNRELNELNDQLDKYKKEDYETRLNNIQEQKESLQSEIIKNQTYLDNLLEKRSQYNSIQKKIQEIEDELNKYIKTYEIIDRISTKVLNEAGNIIAQRLINKVSNRAEKIYRTLAPEENRRLIWSDDTSDIYSLKLKSLINDNDIIDISTLSGGQLMTASISLRLSLMSLYSEIGLGFLDEPTIFLDEERKENLAFTLSQNLITTFLNNNNNWINQLFIITHDEIFSNIGANEIHLSLDDNNTTEIL